MSKTEMKALIEKYVREALAVRAKRVPETKVKKVTREMVRAAEKSVRAAS